MAPPSCTIEELDDFDPSAFDKELSDVLLKGCKGDTKQFLTTVLGFLQRKTNFFKGDDPKKRVLEAYREVAGESLATGFLSKDKPSSGAKAPAAPASTLPPTQPAPAPVAAPAPAPVVPEAASAQQDNAASSSTAEPEKTASKEAWVEDEKEEEKDKGLKPNSGRGADYEHYSWTQTLQEVSVSVPVPAGTKAKMMDVVIKKDHIKVGLKGQPPIIDGELSSSVKVDDCMWAMEGTSVELTLSKQDGMHWWNCVVKGDPIIDTHKVEPENSKLADLDPETRQTVEKMMFDQRQKAMGRPTSDEMQRQEMMKKFMASHPEMDFSQAKMM